MGRGPRTRGRETCRKDTFYWPAQFEQYLTVGQPVETPDWRRLAMAVMLDEDHGVGVRDPGIVGGHLSQLLILRFGFVTGPG